MESRSLDTSDITVSVEQKKHVDVYHCQVSTNFDFSDIVERFSSWSRMLRVICYVQRFINAVSSKQKPLHMYISTDEIHSARNMLIKWVQSDYFQPELKSLKSSNQINAKSPLQSLTPFLDNCGILRVGGRLENADISYNHKHPIILPKNHAISKMIVADFHKRYLHPGSSALINIIRQHFWIICIRSIVKNVSNKCMTCFRYRNIRTQQLMGNLPKARVTVTRPFSKTGVDYAGPISLLNHKGRGSKTSKGYIAVFICMAVKAIHLELVTDLSAEAFISTLRRFISRRGYPSDIFSDNATNFVGANRKLSSLNALLTSTSFNEQINTFTLDTQINWHFIPPSAPNFGGLWESNVKSVKAHLQRVIGETRLTYEEMSTLLCQIEAVLNSRPLSPLHPDADDLSTLTPAHFLVGDHLNVISEPETAINSLSSRWQMVQRMHLHFWKRWNRDFLSSLQQRTKWRHTTSNIKINDLVIIKDETPPAKWALARVINTHPGPDNLTRVVTLKTQGGILKRPISKIVRLPID